MGDAQSEMVWRLRSVLPSRWFGDQTPVLDAVLSGLAAGWVYLTDVIQFVRYQTRLSSASDIWLDIFASDYFGGHLVRSPGQTDIPFRSKIKSRLLAQAGTRKALASGLLALTGRNPIIFEAANTSDTGGYSCLTAPINLLGGGVGYGVNAGWGSLSLPYQCFVTAYRPVTNGVADISGWACPAAGYGVGPVEYADLNLIQGHVADSEILSEITRIAPIGAVIWTRIVS